MHTFVTVYTECVYGPHSVCIRLYTHTPLYTYVTVCIRLSEEAWLFSPHWFTRVPRKCNLHIWNKYMGKLNGGINRVN